MADNISVTAGSGTTVSTEEVTTLNGSAVSAQHVQRVAAAVRTADGSAVDLPGSTTDGLLVNLGANNDVTATQTGTWTVQPGNTANTTPWLVSQSPSTSGGLSISKTVSAASTNPTSVKASAGQVYGIFASNVNASVRYLKLYNKASAPTVGSDTPVLTFAIPGNTAGSGFFAQFPSGIQFTTGIAFALTTEATDSGSTGVSLNEHVINILYK